LIPSYLLRVPEMKQLGVRLRDMTTKSLRLN